MENKEAIEILIKYLRENASYEDLLRVLANYMIDNCRLARMTETVVFIGDLDPFYKIFLKRVARNAVEIENVIAGKGDSGFTYSELDPK